MRELSTDELDTVIGGTVFSYPGVYIQEVSANLISIPELARLRGSRRTPCIKTRPHSTTRFFNSDGRQYAGFQSSSRNGHRHVRPARSKSADIVAKVFLG